MIKIVAYPKCTQCGMPFVLRFSVVFETTGRIARTSQEWIWQRDCKHKKGEIEIVSTKFKHPPRPAPRPAPKPKRKR